MCVREDGGLKVDLPTYTEQAKVYWHDGGDTRKVPGCVNGACDALDRDQGTIWSKCGFRIINANAVAAKDVFVDLVARL